MNDCKAQVIVKLYCDTHSLGNDVVYIIPGSSYWSWITDFSSVSALGKKESLPHRIENTGVARVKLLWWAYKSNIDCNLKVRLYCIICISSICRSGKWQCPVVFLFQVNLLYSHSCELSTQEVVQWKFFLFPTETPGGMCISPFRNDVCICIYSLRQLSLSK